MTNFTEESCANHRPGPIPQAGKRRFDIFNLFRPIHGKKNISRYTAEVAGGRKSEMEEIYGRKARQSRRVARGACQRA